MAMPIVEKPLTAEAAARCAGVAAGLVALAGGALTLNHMLPGVFYDDGLYVGIAYALSHGLGYAHAHLPGYPAAVHFPPLYPLVLAPFVGLLPLSAAVFAAKVLNIRSEERRVGKEGRCLCSSIGLEARETGS